MVQLVSVAAGKLPQFGIFMFIWLVYFSIAYYMLGNEISGGDNFIYIAPHNKWDSIEAEWKKNPGDALDEVGNDYSNLPTCVKYLIQAWRNAIGDLSPPEYPNWIALKG